MSVLRLPAFAALLLAFLLAGCGGGGKPFTDLAPLSVNGRTIVIQDPTQPLIQTSYVFGASTYTATGGDSGTYSYAKIPGTTTQANLVITSSFNPALSFVLTFTTTGGGTYVDQSSATSTFTIN
jgi:hypothetical protein